MTCSWAAARCRTLSHRPVRSFSPLPCRARRTPSSRETARLAGSPSTTRDSRSPARSRTRWPDRADASRCRAPTARLPLDLVTLAPNDFAHLHVHSEFSLLDGLGRITELVDEAKARGFDSLAVTDHGALYGAVAFYQACRNAGIKPIIGVETYVARRAMTDREGKSDDKPYH